MAIGLRPFGEQDSAAVAAINNRLYPDHRLTAAEWWLYAQRLDETRYARRRYVAVDPDAHQVVGYGVASHVPVLFHPQKYWLHVMVDPQWQRRGIGSLLFDRLLDDLRAWDVTTLWTEVREDKADALAFVQKRGFAEARRTWELRLAVDAVDLAPLLPLAQQAEAQGVSITTLAAERPRDADCAAKLYALTSAVAADVPAPFPAWPTPFQDFARWLDYPDTLRDGLFIAVASGEYIGLSTLSRTEGEPQMLYLNLTGVRREHRRRGAATALKLRTIQYAQRHACRTMVVRNDSANAPMIALNLKLGFRYHTGWVTLTAAARR